MTTFAAPSVPALVARDLTKSFGGNRVLNGVDLTVTSGITAVVGASGCGKTTLLRLIAGFEAPDRGSVSIAGRDVAGNGPFIPAHRRQVGYVAQDGALFPHLSVGQNIAYGLRGGLRSHRVRTRVQQLLETVSLDDSYIARWPHELSGGQQQRVALARALARQPVLMLLDEPFSALDTGLRAATRKAVARTLAEAAVTTLLVTHDQEEALSIADQVAVMRNGRFTQVGAPREVYGAPTDPFTARFLGDCVFVPAVVDGAFADCPLGRVAVHNPSGGPAATVMFRPEQLAAKEVSGKPQRCATGTVIAVEFLGADVIVTIDLGGDQTPITVRQPSVDPPAMDAKVEIVVTGKGVAFDRSDQ